MFGVNNAAEFKVALTKQEMLIKMERGQKILKGIPVEGYVDEDAVPVGAHFSRPPPKNVVKQKRKIAVGGITGGGSTVAPNAGADGDSGTDALPGRVPSPRGNGKKTRGAAGKYALDEGGTLVDVNVAIGDVVHHSWRGYNAQQHQHRHHVRRHPAAATTRGVGSLRRHESHAIDLGVVPLSPLTNLSHWRMGVTAKVMGIWLQQRGTRQSMPKTMPATFRHLMMRRGSC